MSIRLSGPMRLGDPDLTTLTLMHVLLTSACCVQSACEKSLDRASRMLQLLSIAPKVAPASVWPTSREPEDPEARCLDPQEA